MQLSNDQEVDLFKAFLRINTMHPNPDLASCLTWLKQHAEEMKMGFQVVEYVKGLPVIIMTRPGQDPSLSSLILNCHMDVVPVVPEKWTALPKEETPFTAYEDQEGKIYARGSQDMKCVGAQYLCALRRLNDAPLKRTIHCIWVPDEEIGGPQGMRLFAESPEFKALHAGCALDEGLAHPEDKYVVYYGERTPLWFKFYGEGQVGHGAKLLEDTVAERLSNVVTHLANMRKQSVNKLKENPSYFLGDVTSINITVMQSGTSNDGGKTWACNVIPSSGFVIADIRITPDEYDDVMSELDQIAKENGLKIDYQGQAVKKSGINPNHSMESWFKVLDTTLSAWSPVEKQIFPAATDSRYIRHAGVPAFGFSPMRKIPSLLHDHNEYLPRSTYLEGVDVYTKLIPQLANLALQPGES